MSKCQARWVDPTVGVSANSVGPYACGRQLGHKGVHAWDGNGASALWSQSGELLLSIQQVPSLPLPDLLDTTDGNAAQEAASGVGSGERKESGKR